MTLYYVLPLRFTIFESLLDISIFFLMEKQDLSLNELILRWSSAMALMLMLNVSSTISWARTSASGTRMACTPGR